jgi:predicted alpha/beta hydrolase family esterase
VENAGHINGQSGYGRWPQGIKLLFTLTGDPQFQLE